MTAIHRRIAIPAIALLIGALSGCNSGGGGLGGMFGGGVRTTVKIPGAAISKADVPPREEALVTEPYEVELRSSSAKCAEGIRHIRNEDYAAAIDALEDAVKQKPNDQYAHFALGVAYESSGHYDQALEHYKSANAQTSKTDKDYDASRRRAQAKAKYAAPTGGSTPAKP